jgi:ribosomal-protein-serine acetyltransferase
VASGKSLIYTNAAAMLDFIYFTLSVQKHMLPAGSFILRPYHETDAEDMSSAVRESAETVGRWMTWAKPDFSEYDAVCWFEHCSRSRAEGTAHEFGIFSSAGQFVGGCGLNQFSTINKFCNLGYWVRRSHQRIGAATAAVLALRELALHRLGLSRVEIVVAEGNVASIGVARKAGATHECLARNRLQLHGKPVSAHVFSFTCDVDV